MTKYVQAPELETIRIANLFGEVMMEQEPPRLPDGEENPDAGKLRPALMTYQKWLLQRTTDAKFFGKKEGIDAYELTKLAREQILATAGVKGVHTFDNEVAEALRSAILHPTSGHLGELSLEHNWFEWALLWKEPLKNKPPAVLNLPSGGDAEPTSEGDQQS